MIETSKRTKAARITALVVGVVAAVGFSVPAGTAFAYTPQDCGTNHYGTGSASASIYHDTTFIAGCGMKAAIKCQQGSNFDATWRISTGSQTDAGQSRTVNCPAGWTRWQYGHQEGTNW